MSLCHDILTGVSANHEKGNLLSLNTESLHSDIVSACIQADAAIRAGRAQATAAWASGIATVVGTLIALGAAILAYRSATRDARDVRTRNKKEAQIFAAVLLDLLRAKQSSISAMLRAIQDRSYHGLDIALSHSARTLGKHLISSDTTSINDLHLAVSLNTIFLIKQSDRNCEVCGDYMNIIGNAIKDEESVDLPDEVINPLIAFLKKAFETNNQAESSLRAELPEIPQLKAVTLPKTPTGKKNA